MSDECIEPDTYHSSLIDEMHEELIKLQQQQAAPRGCSANYAGSKHLLQRSFMGSSAETEFNIQQPLHGQQQLQQQCFVSGHVAAASPPASGCNTNSLAAAYDGSFAIGGRATGETMAASNCGPRFLAGAVSVTAQQQLAQQQRPADAASIAPMQGVSDSTNSFKSMSQNVNHAHDFVYGTSAAAAQQGRLETYAVAGLKTCEPVMLQPLSSTVWPTLPGPGQPAYDLPYRPLLALDVEAGRTAAAAVTHWPQHHPEIAHRLLQHGSLDSTCSSSAAFLRAVNVNSECPATSLSPLTALPPSPPPPPTAAAVHLACQELASSPAARLYQPTAVLAACQATQPLDIVPCSSISPSSTRSSTSLQSMDLCSVCAALVQEGNSFYSAISTTDKLDAHTRSNLAAFLHKAVHDCQHAAAHKQCLLKEQLPDQFDFMWLISRPKARLAPTGLQRAATGTRTARNFNLNTNTPLPVDSRTPEQLYSIRAADGQLVCYAVVKLAPTGMAETSTGGDSSAMASDISSSRSNTAARHWAPAAVRCSKPKFQGQLFDLFCWAFICCQQQNKRKRDSP